MTAVEAQGSENGGASIALCRGKVEREIGEKRR